MAVITLSRQSGSEGNEITRLLCERLGYRYFDKALMAELAAKLAAETGQLTDQVADIFTGQREEKRFLASLQKLFAGPTPWTPGVQSDDPEALSVQNVRKLIEAAYQHGDVVIVGRGGQVVLADKPDVLHVRVVAPTEIRIRRWMEREGLSYMDAQARVHERDEVHSGFVKRFFDADVNDPTLYDLVINTEKLSPAAAADVIINTLAHLPVPD